MLEKYKYPYFSIDHLKMGLIRSGITDLTPEDDDELIELLLKFKWWDKRVEEINSLIPILTCSDLEKVREEIEARL